MIRTENVMAGKLASCPLLVNYYNLPSEEKKLYLDTEVATGLLTSLPQDISAVLVERFLSGESLFENSGRKVIDYFRTHSHIIPDLVKYPGTYTMLEKMYNFEKVSWPIDIFFSKSLPGGISLKSRFEIVNKKAAAHIREVLARQDKCLVLDLGSGPGRNEIALNIENPDFKERVEFHCIDIDPMAIKYGQELVAKYGLKNIIFVEKSMTKLYKQYRRNVDYGLIIGILCGLSMEERTGLLKIVRLYFKPKARVVGAGLLDRMLELDFFCSYILRETAGWILQHPPIGMIQKAFEDAGYEYEGFFQEEPTRCYEIGVGLV